MLNGISLPVGGESEKPTTKSLWNSSFFGVSYSTVTRSAWCCRRTRRWSFAEKFRDRPELVDPGKWPGEDLLDLLAMAQHHSVPTRLLDWTRNPYAAIYFAASDALRRIADGESEGSLAVWAFDTASVNHYREDVRTFRPPGSVSPHLAAQSGVFTVQMLGGVRGEPLDVEPLETVFAKLPDSPLTKFTVPITASPRLVRYCERVGVSGARMFPSADGAGQAVIRNSDLWAAEEVLHGASSV